VKPAFLGIGAHKAGTTWLYRQLAAHPEIGFTADEKRVGRIAMKERHFWCRDLHSRRDRPRWPGPLDQALVAYRARLPDGKISGDITPHYAILDEEVVRQVAESLPGVRLVYLLREPRARAWSSAVSNYAEVEASLPGFGRSRHAEVWEAPTRRESVVFDERAEEWLRARLIGSVLLAHSDYASVVKRWRRYFPEEALLLVTTDDVSTDPRGLLRRVFRHVGADPVFADRIPDADLAAWVNPHRPAPRVPLALQGVLDETYLPLVEPLERLMGWDLSRWKERPAEYGD
jgi:hypothetical protein